MGTILFKLEVFEGPLDLLLNLISKHKLNIHDIEISKLLEQYLIYMRECTEADYELAGEFLEIAAHLIYIKTVSLLPQPEESEELKKELQGKLIEYSLCKIAASELRKNFIGDDIFFRKPMEIDLSKTVYNFIHEPYLLAQAYLNMGQTRRISQQKTNVNIEEKIRNVSTSRTVVSVFSKVVRILRELCAYGSANIDELYDGIINRSERVAIFLALLELCRSGRIVLNSDNTVISFKNKAA